jgi:hypothetical protein
MLLGLFVLRKKSNMGFSLRKLIDDISPILKANICDDLFFLNIILYIYGLSFGNLASGKLVFALQYYHSYLQVSVTQ